MDDSLDEDRTEQDIKALGDSVKVIDDVLALDTPDSEAVDAVDRNVRHIEIMLAKDHIKNSGEDLTIFEDAIARGKDLMV